MTIVDGCAVLWKIQWPSANGTVHDLVKGFHKFVYDMLKKNDVMIIFDRYYDYSIKSVTRENINVIQSSKRVKITLTGPAHDKNVVLAHKDNKIQLIRILMESLKTLQLQGRESERKLIVTGLDPIPFEVCRGNVRDRLDLKNLQEEADTIIVAQMLSMVNEGYRQIQVICEYTDVFVILLHHYHQQKLSEQVPPVHKVCSEITFFPNQSQTLPDFAFGATDTTKKIHRPTPSGNSGSGHAHFLAYSLYR